MRAGREGAVRALAVEAIPLVTRSRGGVTGPAVARRLLLSIAVHGTFAARG